MSNVLSFIQSDRSINDNSKEVAIHFIETLITDSEIIKDGYVTRAEIYDFGQRIQILDLRNGANDWLLQRYIDPFQDSTFKIHQTAWNQSSNKDFEVVTITNYDGNTFTASIDIEQRSKLKEINDFGLKIYIPNNQLSMFGNSEETLRQFANRAINLAYARVLALKESKETNIPMTIVLDSFFSYNLIAHGNTVNASINRLGGIPLPYEINHLEDSSLAKNIYEEIINLKHNMHYSFGSLNLSAGPSYRESTLADFNAPNVNENNIGTSRNILANAYLNQETGPKYINIFNFVSDLEKNGNINVYVSAGNNGTAVNNTATLFNPYSLIAGVDSVTASYNDTISNCRYTYNPFTKYYASPNATMRIHYDRNSGLKVDFYDENSIDYTSEEDIYIGDVTLNDLKLISEPEFEKVLNGFMKLKSLPRSIKQALTESDTIPDDFIQLLEEESEELKNLYLEIESILSTSILTYEEFTTLVGLIEQCLPSFLSSNRININKIIQRYKESKINHSYILLGSSFFLSNPNVEVIPQEDGSLEFSGTIDYEGTSISSPQVAAFAAQGLEENALIPDSAELLCSE